MDCCCARDRAGALVPALHVLEIPDGRPGVGPDVHPGAPSARLGDSERAPAMPAAAPPPRLRESCTSSLSFFLSVRGGRRPVHATPLKSLRPTNRHQTNARFIHSHNRFSVDKPVQRSSSALLDTRRGRAYTSRREDVASSPVNTCRIGEPWR